VIGWVIENHLDRAGADLRRKTVRSLVRQSIFGADGNRIEKMAPPPGASLTEM
jgi:hypothetical protein